MTKYLVALFYRLGSTFAMCAKASLDSGSVSSSIDMILLSLFFSSHLASSAFSRKKKALCHSIHITLVSLLGKSKSCEENRNRDEKDSCSKLFSHDSSLRYFKSALLVQNLSLVGFNV